MANIDLYVWMCLVKPFKTFWSSDDAHEFDILAAMLFDEIYGSYSGTAGCQHWVSDNNETLVDGAWQFAVIFMRLVGDFIAV